MVSLSYQMILILYQTFKILLNLSQNKETLPTNTSIHIYISRINNKLVIKTEDGYKLDIETPETMKLFGSINELIEKTKKVKICQVFK